MADFDDFVRRFISWPLGLEDTTTEVEREHYSTFLGSEDSASSPTNILECLLRASDSESQRHRYQPTATQSQQSWPRVRGQKKAIEEQQEGEIKKKRQSKTEALIKAAEERLKGDILRLEDEAKEREKGPNSFFEESFNGVIEQGEAEVGLMGGVNSPEIDLTCSF